MKFVDDGYGLLCIQLRGLDMQQVPVPGDFVPEDHVIFVGECQALFVAGLVFLLDDVRWWYVQRQIAVQEQRIEHGRVVCEEAAA